MHVRRVRFISLPWRGPHTEGLILEAPHRHRGPEEILSCLTKNELQHPDNLPSRSWNILLIKKAGVVSARDVEQALLDEREHLFQCRRKSTGNHLLLENAPVDIAPSPWRARGTAFSTIRIPLITAS